jgi:hypothetical protein
VGGLQYIRPLVFHGWCCSAFRNVSRIYKAATMASRVLQRTGNTANLLSSMHHILKDEPSPKLREALLDPLRVGKHGGIIAYDLVSK